MKTTFFLLVRYLMGVACAQVFHVAGSIKLLPVWAYRYLFCECNLTIPFRHGEIATKWISGPTDCQLSQAG